MNLGTPWSHACDTCDQGGVQSFKPNSCLSAGHPTRVAGTIEVQLWATFGSRKMGVSLSLFIICANLLKVGQDRDIHGVAIQTWHSSRAWLLRSNGRLCSGDEFHDKREKKPQVAGSRSFIVLCVCCWCGSVDFASVSHAGGIACAVWLYFTMCNRIACIYC